MKKVVRIDANGKQKTYRDIMEASKDIKSGLDYWKIALYIADAINNNRKAFKCKWKMI